MKKPKDTIEISASLPRMAMMVAGCAGFIAIGLVLLSVADWLAWIIGLSVIIFFGLIATVSVWRLFTLRGNVVTLAPEGFRDIRIAPQIVRWSEIEDVGTWRSPSQKVMILKVDGDTWKRLTLTPLAQRSRTGNIMLGADGLPVATAELKVVYENLYEDTMRYWKAYRGKP
ncbi:MAG: STM3941 family protein [Pseudomonadota bacterium]